MRIPIARRTLLKAGLLAPPLCGWMGNLAPLWAGDPTRKRACILLWMAGGPSQTDTLDLKPGHANGGPFREIETAVSGIKICEHLPGIAKRMDQLALVRSMSTREGDHGRASLHLHTGYSPQGAIQFPTLGALVARERDRADADLPSFVSVGQSGGSPGFLGPRYAPLVVGAGEGGGDASFQVEDLGRARGIDQARAEKRLELLREMGAEFLASRTGAAAQGHRTAYDQASRLMRESAARAFDLSEEKAELRDQYGRDRFGQGCLLARRLVERGVPFVEVALGGWDTHDDNFRQVQSLCGALDRGWSALLDDLSARGMLDGTLVVWMGEFGRTPAINPRNGRDHFPAAWSMALAGGGIRTGQVYGRTSADGMFVEDRPVAVPDLLATICLALGIDPAKQNQSNVNRPIRVVDPSAKPLRELLV